MYHPSIWSHEFIESLDCNFPVHTRPILHPLVPRLEVSNHHHLAEGHLSYTLDTAKSKAVCYIPINKEKAAEQNKEMMSFNIDYESGSLSTLQLLELIDDIERLGLGYHFQKDITRVLNSIASINGNNLGLEEEQQESLHAMSLRFRLLRQHGYNVSQDFLLRFMDSHGDFKECLQTNGKGMLNLYEASYLAFEEETNLQEARLFATEHLLKLKDRENEVAEHINHALELPLYRRMVRLQTRWYIDAYNRRKDANRLLLDLATLDFNMVQLSHKKELQEVSKWWENTGLARKLDFIRDRLMECFFWAVGMAFEPQYHSCRVGLTKIGSLITTIDDIYDVYGSQDELKLFTDAVKSWDINATKQMPEYLKLGFLALYDTINEMGCSSSITQGENITPILVAAWGELLEMFFVEKKWSDNKYMPTLENYLDIAWRSVSGVVLLTHGYFLIKQDTKKDTVRSLENYHDLLKWSSMIFRLCNDLATSPDEMKSGKTINAISCYMHENGVCEEVAREYILILIDEAWRKLIKAQVDCAQESPDPFIDMAINLARVSHCVYQYGDGHGAPDARAKNQILSVIIEPVTISDKEDQCP